MFNDRILALKGDKMDKLEHKNNLESEEFEITNIEEVVDEKISKSKEIGNKILFCAKKIYFLFLLDTSRRAVLGYEHEVEMMQQHDTLFLTIGKINLGLFSILFSAKLVKCLYANSNKVNAYSIFPAILATSGIGVLMSAVNPGYDASGFYQYYMIYSYFVGLVTSGALFFNNDESPQKKKLKK